MNIPSPIEFFGVMPGSDRTMIRWDKLCEYYRLLGTLSKKLIVEEKGKTSEGNDFLILYVSSSENLQKLEEYRIISKKLADPRELNESEINDLCENGKVICFQSYGLHSNEVGGPQMVPLMLFELLTSDEKKIKDILENVIFIISPCSEPDGEIVFTDWYNKYLGTEFEGTVSPYLRHNWAGHSNNRDAMREILIESRHLNDIIIRRFMPQIFQDHHHQCPFENRMSIAPSSDPIYPFYSPLVHRETAVYGAVMADALSKAGRKGVVSGDKRFNDFPISTFYSTAMLHNVAGMLTENADVNIATPVYIHFDSLEGELSPGATCPDPWYGGEWHLYDIVEQMYIASVSLLEYAAKNRFSILENMARKALLQTARGKNSERKAYLITPNQNDVSAKDSLLTLMHNHEIEMFKAKGDFVCNNNLYPKGTVAIPLGQPAYAAVETFLGANPYPVIPEIKRADGAVKITDMANLSFALCMGVKVSPSMGDIDESLLERYIPCIDETLSLPLPVSENLSFKKANILLEKGEKVARDENGNFVKEGEGKLVRRKKIGLLKKSATWNEEEGYTRSLLKMYHFDYRIILDKEIRESGIPDDIDVIILPGDSEADLKSGDSIPVGRPPEFQSGLGTAGAEYMREFAKRGGLIIAWEKSCVYVRDILSLEITDTASRLSAREYSTYGSQIYAKLKKDKLTFGMPESFTLTHSSGPALIPRDFVGKTEVIARIADKNILANGHIVGEKHIEGTPCILRTHYGKGEVLLYTFNPEFRAQQDGTFKLLFNALFEVEKDV